MENTCQMSRFWVIVLLDGRTLGECWMKKLVYSLFIMAIVSPATAQQIMPKIGSFCPSNYRTDGAYCVPGSGASMAIHKVGPFCPNGYRTDGEYCIAGPNVGFAFPRIGSFCPSGTRADGDYCISS